MIAEVIIDIKKQTLNNTKFSYLVAEKDESIIKKGCRVLVPFGQGNALRIGYVINLLTNNTFYQQKLLVLKKIHAVLDLLPVISQEAFFLARNFRQNYHFFINVSLLFENMVPNFLLYDYFFEITILKKEQIPLLLQENFNKKGKWNLKVSFFTKKKQNFSQLLQRINILQKKQIITLKKKIKLRFTQKKIINSKKIIPNSVFSFDIKQKISQHQHTKTPEKIWTLLQKEKALFVQMNFFASVPVVTFLIQQVKGIILILFPEKEMINFFATYLKKDLEEEELFIYKDLNKSEEYLFYQKLEQQKIKVILASMKGIFLLIPQIDAIVFFEGSNENYLQEQQKTLSYNLLDIIFWRQQYHKCLLLLQSSIVNFFLNYKIEKTKMKTVNLLPQQLQQKNFTLIDFKKNTNNNSFIFSDVIFRNITQDILKKQKSLIIVNNKGSKIFYCFKCKIRKQEKDIKNYQCLKCLQIVTPISLGTVFVAKQLQKRFQQALKIIIIDSANMTPQNLYALFSKKTQGDIFIGTEMALKHIFSDFFENIYFLFGEQFVTFPSFKAVSHSAYLFQQALQLSRKKVFIQYSHGQFFFESQFYDNNAFLISEQKNRLLQKLPPFYFIYQINISGKNYLKLFQYVLTVEKFFQKQKKEMSDLILFEPKEITQEEKNSFALIIKFAPKNFIRVNQMLQKIIDNKYQIRIINIF